MQVPKVPAPLPPPTAAAQTAPWYHVQLQSAGPDAASIGVDFQEEGTHAAPDTLDLRANPVWINVQRPDLGPSDHVTAVLIDQKYRYDWDVGAPQVQSVDLTYAGKGRFTGQFQPLPLEEDTYGADAPSYAARQQIAVVANGDWLTDPVSGTHNFNFDMGDTVVRATD